MAISASSKQKFIFIFSVISMFTLCFYSGYAEDSPGEIVENALLCFNKKIYSGCNETYRLTESGNLNVPPEATDLFCNGPCLTETKNVLSCINYYLSDFLFHNKATVRDIEFALNAGCSNTNLRGNFNVARYLGGGTSKGLQIIALLPWLPSLLSLVLH